MKETFSLEKQRTNDLIKGLKKLVEDWNYLIDHKNTAEGLEEWEVRDAEKSIVRDLIQHLKNNPQEGDNPELKFVAEEYLRIGDCIDLAGELAPLVKLKYYDPLTTPDRPEGAIGPDLSAKSFLKEIGEDVGEVKKDKMN